MALVACTLTVLMYVLVQQLRNSSFISNENENVISNPEIPPTWNLDWQGGPGFDRYKIINEKGPYNPHGVEFESD